MRVLSRICSFFAIRLLYREWYELRRELVNMYASRRKDEYTPTALAQQLLISGEDHRFFRHGGIDPIAVCRAIWRGIALGKHEGASTIEMQVVRVVSERFEPTLRRKIQEMALATLLTRAIPKEQLPALYLQIGYYGWRMNGFKEACQRLGVAVDFSLTPMEAARFVARLKYPEPHLLFPKRENQINTRAQHLIGLYTKHRLNKTYVGLTTKTA